VNAVPKFTAHDLALGAWAFPSGALLEVTLRRDDAGRPRSLVFGLAAREVALGSLWY
jgi:hypothetical protein